MAGRRKAFLGGLALIAVIAAVLATAGPVQPRPLPPGRFAFAVLGDAPYAPWEELQYRLVRREIALHDLRFVVHVGDLFSGWCGDDRYAGRLAWLQDLRHPMVITPGDNDWTDCWEFGAGRFAPLERLEAFRRTFHPQPDRSLGNPPMPLVRQLPEFVENARWESGGVVFATVNVPGSANGREPFPARTDRDDRAAGVRTEAAAAWVRATFAKARARGAGAVVIAWHGDAALGAPPGHSYARNYEPFASALAEEAARFPGPVLVAHGDGHVFTVDRPLPNVTRLEVPGSPRVGWVEVVVSAGPPPRFEFRPHVVPRWKYW